MDYIETFFSLSLQGILTCLALQNSPVNEEKKFSRKNLIHNFCEKLTMQFDEFVPRYFVELHQNIKYTILSCSKRFFFTVLITTENLKFTN